MPWKPAPPSHSASLSSLTALRWIQCQIHRTARWTLTWRMAICRPIFVLLFFRFWWIYYNWLSEAIMKCRLLLLRLSLVAENLRPACHLYFSSRRERCFVKTIQRVERRYCRTLGQMRAPRWLSTDRSRSHSCSLSARDWALRCAVVHRCMRRR